jgi:hypothetical protein
MACEVCGREVEEVCWSDQLGVRCCERCHSRGTPPSNAPRRRAPRAPVYKPTPYELLVRRVWDALAEAGTVFYVGPRYIAGWCPACRMGTVNVHFIGGDEDPKLRLLDGCTAGCSTDDLARVLL